MGEIKVLGGDFPPNTRVNFLFDIFGIFDDLNDTEESIPVRDIKRAAIASEEIVRQMNVGAGVLGTLVLGPIGAFAAAGSRRDVTFVVEFNDGRKMLGVTDLKTYGEIEKHAPKKQSFLSKAQQEHLDKVQETNRRREELREKVRQADAKKRNKFIGFGCLGLIALYLFLLIGGMIVRSLT